MQTLPDSSRRPRVLLGTLLVGWFLLLSVQARRPGSEGNILEEWTLTALRPLIAFAGTIDDGIHGLSRKVTGLRDAARENVILSDELQQARLELERLRSYEQDARRLESLLDYRREMAPEGRLARVVHTATEGSFLGLVLDRGELHGVREGSPLIEPSGLVGRVVVATPRLAKVQLLIDPNAAAGARAARSRVTGVVRGTGESGYEMLYVARGADVKVGDRIISAGNDAVYPAGFTIGTVTLAQDEDGAFRRILIRPSIVPSQLDEVLVLPPVELPPGLTETTP